MNFHAFAQELRTLLIEGKTQAALDQLLNFYDDKKGEYYDEVIVLAGQMRRLRDKSIAGAISGEEANQQANSINHSLLQIIDDLHNDTAVARHFGLEMAGDDVTSKIEEAQEVGNKKSSAWQTILGMLIGGFLAFLAIKSLTPTETATTSDEENTTIKTIKKVEPKDQVYPNYEPTERRIQKQESKVAEEKSGEQVSPKQEEAQKLIIPKDNPSNSKNSFNDTPNKALPLTFGKSVRAMLNSSEDRNYFKVKIPKAGRLTINYQCKAEQLRVRLQVFDRNKNRILQNTATAKGASFEQSFSVREGTYLLLMENYRSQFGKYELGVTLE
ncbi:MAG: hypothetical protein AAGG68_28170 [Bacteroidota bacterium]